MISNATKDSSSSKESESRKEEEEERKVNFFTDPKEYFNSLMVKSKVKLKLMALSFKPTATIDPNGEKYKILYIVHLEKNLNFLKRILIHLSLRHPSPT